METTPFIGMPPELHNALVEFFSEAKGIKGKVAHKMLLGLTQQCRVIQVPNHADGTPGTVNRPPVDLDAIRKKREEAEEALADAKEE
jgi:hypothetical protein